MTAARIARWAPVLVARTLVAGCSWRPYAGVVRASSEAYQAENTTVADDGTVTFGQGRLEGRLRRGGPRPSERKDEPARGRSETR